MKNEIEIDVDLLSKCIDTYSEKATTLINGIGEIIGKVDFTDTIKSFIRGVDIVIEESLTHIIHAYSGLALANKNIKISNIPNQIDVDDSHELSVIVVHPNAFDTDVYIYNFKDADKKEDVELHLLHKISIVSKVVTAQEIKYELGIFVDKFMIPKYEFDGE